MDNVDRIVPITPLGAGLQLRVSESNKDGSKQHTEDETPQSHPHDVLELHDEEVPLEELNPEESVESPTFGLDLAV
jgi:hypothetical protein